MANVKGLLMAGAVFVLAFLWKVFIWVMAIVAFLFIVKKIIDKQYENSMGGKW